MENITDILAELRKSHSQSELSRLTGISQSKLSRWEAGRVAGGADDALKLLALAKRTTPTPQETNGEVAQVPTQQVDSSVGHQPAVVRPLAFGLAGFFF